MAQDVATNQQLLEKAQAGGRHRPCRRPMRRRPMSTRWGMSPAPPRTSPRTAAIDPFVFRIAIFALACFVGYYVVWSVTPALHTPLMSGHQRDLLGHRRRRAAVRLASMRPGSATTALIWARVFGFVALTLASVNIFGGFLVTERMLGMYKKKG